MKGPRGRNEQMRGNSVSLVTPTMQKHFPRHPKGMFVMGEVPYGCSSDPPQAKKRASRKEQSRFLSQTIKWAGIETPDVNF